MIEPPPNGTVTGRSWLASGLAAAFATLVAALAISLHTVTIRGGEDDHYLRGLDNWQVGGVVYDGFHPLHTVLFGAVLQGLFGFDSFTALRLVSALSAGAIVGCTFALARALGARRWGCVATAIVALHPAVLTLGMQAASDALAAALVLLTLTASVAAARTRRLLPLVLASLGFGLALGTRFTIAPFGLALLFAWRRATLGRDVVATALGTAIGFLPHGFLVWRMTGSPFHNENWRSIVLKHGGFDQRLIGEPGFDNLSEFLAQHGGDVLRLGLDDLQRQLTGGLGALLTGGEPSLATTIVGAVALLALSRLPFVAERAGGMLTVGFLAMWTTVCLTFSPLERVLLPLVPVAAIALAAATTAAARPWRIGAGIGLAATGLLTILALPPRLAEFLAEHPHAEIAAAARLLADPEVELAAATYTDMPRHAPRIAVWQPDLAPRRAGATEAVAALRATMARTGANGFLLGKRTAPVLFAQVRSTSLPPDMRVLAADDDVVLVVAQGRIPDGGSAGRWFQATEVAPNPWTSGTLTIRADLAPDADPARVAEVSVRLEPPEAGPVLPLQRLGDRQWGTPWTVRPPPGQWFLQFRLRLHDGRHVFGPRVAIGVQ